MVLGHLIFRSFWGSGNRNHKYAYEVALTIQVDRIQEAHGSWIHGRSFKESGCRRHGVRCVRFIDAGMGIK